MVARGRCAGAQIARAAEEVLSSDCGDHLFFIHPPYLCRMTTGLRCRNIMFRRPRRRDRRAFLELSLYLHHMFTLVAEYGLGGARCQLPKVNCARLPKRSEAWFSLPVSC